MFPTISYAFSEKCFSLNYGKINQITWRMKCLKFKISCVLKNGKIKSEFCIPHEKKYHYVLSTDVVSCCWLNDMLVRKKQWSSNIATIITQGI